MDIIKKVDEIITGNILKKNSKLYLNNYLREFIETLEMLFISDNNNGVPKLILTLDEEPEEFLILLVCGIIMLYKNLTLEGGDIGDYIEFGDIVVYKNKKYKYLGKEICNGKEKVKLEGRKTKQKGNICSNIEYIDIKDSNKLKFYHGESEKLGKLKNVMDYKKKFREMIGVSDELIDGIITEQVLVVFESKREMEELLNNYYIRINEDKYTFPEIFPCRYYSSDENTVNLNGNIDKELFLFTSKLEVAKEILINNESCKNIIFLGEDTYKNEIGGALFSIFKRLKHKRLSNVVIFNNFNNVKTLGKLIEEDINIYSWNKGYVNHKYSEDSRYLNAYDSICKSFLYETQNEIIDDDNVNKLYSSLNKNLLMLLRSKEDINYKDEFIKAAYRLFIMLQDIVYPIKKYEDKYRELMNQQIQVLKEILKENDGYSIYTNLLSPVIRDIDSLVEYLYERNRKIRKVKKLSSEESILICGSESEKKMLLAENKLAFKRIITKYELDFKCEDEILIFLSDYKETREFQYSYIVKNKIINILNNVQAKRYNRKVKYTNSLLDKIIEKSLITIDKVENDSLDYMNKIEIKDTKLNLKNIDEDLDDVVEDFVEIESNEDEYNYSLNNLLNLVASKYTYKSVQISNKCKVDKMLSFDKGRTAFIRKDSDIYVFNERDKTVRLTQKVKIGDTIMFLDEKTDKDLDDLFDDIINSKIFEDTYYEHYENVLYWKKALNNYMDKYNFTFEDISVELSRHGINKKGATIKQWLNSSVLIIGPLEKEFYEKLAIITCDYKLKNQWEEIYESNNKVREFRTKFKKEFKNIIIRSMQGINYTEDELEILVRKVFGDLSEYVKVVQIKDIKYLNEEMPYSKTNCISYLSEE